MTQIDPSLDTRHPQALHVFQKPANNSNPSIVVPIRILFAHVSPLLESPPVSRLVKGKSTSSLSSAYVSCFRAKRGTLSRFPLVRSPTPPDTGALLHLSRASFPRSRHASPPAQSSPRHVLARTRVGPAPVIKVS